MLIKLKASGLADSSLKSISDKLMHLARYCDLDNPHSVKQFVASKDVKKSYKATLWKAYNYYAKVNGLNWEKPKFNLKKGLPRPPRTEQVKQLIAGASMKYAPIFKLMSETGASSIEGSILKEEDFDFENNRVFIEGRKGHLDRVIPMNSELSALIKTYFAKYQNFPRNEMIGQKFRKYRNRLAKTLNDKALKNVRLYDLRHYFGTMTYYKTKDILYVKDLMGHSKIETTMIYTKLVNFNAIVDMVGFNAIV